MPGRVASDPIERDLVAASAIGLPTLDITLSLAGVFLFGPIGMYAGIVAVTHAGAAALRTRSRP